MRRLLSCLVVAIGVLAVVSAAAAPAAGAGSSSTGAVVDGVQFGYLPTGLGDSTDFAYEYDDVAFASRVWESGSDATGWQVDLKVDVMRGVGLRTGQALHDWFVEYQDRPPAEVRYVRVRIHDHPGWACRDQVFWLVRPGLAVSVRVDATRWTRAEALRIARAARVMPM
jgi:hypothetical protein